MTRSSRQLGKYNIMTSEINITSIGLLFFLSINAIKTENTCTDRQATCINIRKCPYIIEVTREEKPLPPGTVETVKKLRCGIEGNDPMIWCILQNTTSLPMITDSLSDAENNIPDPPDVTRHPNLRLLDHHTCGPFIPQNFLGTTKTRIFDYPWMVLLAYKVGDNDKFRYYCGGSIISNRYILTAAQCIINTRSSSQLAVRAGARNINKERDCDIDLDGHEVQCSEKYQDFGVESVHPHPDYTGKNNYYDIGLIRLNDTIDFSPFSVKPICLPFGSAAMLNQRTATVTGWGHKTLHSAYDFDFELSPSLLHAKLPLVSNDKCKEIYKNISEIWYKQICAGGLTMDACLGDAGGPLQAPGMYNGTVRTIQYGIVSSGLGPCGIVGYPGVYTKVSYYMDWILDIMRD